MLCGQTRARVFNGAAAVRSSSRFFARRSDGALRATTIIRLRPHMAGLWSSNAMGACLPDQVKTHPLFRIGCAERGAILPVRVPEVVKTIYFLKKRARLFFNSQNYSIFALDFAE